MPIYEYQCAACEEVFEEMQKISAPPLDKCKLCGASRVRRLISQTSFQFKGTGWYVTDYARKGRGKRQTEGESGTNGTAQSTQACTGCKDSKGSGCPATPAS